MVERHLLYEALPEAIGESDGDNSGAHGCFHPEQMGCVDGAIVIVFVGVFKIALVLIRKSFHLPHWLSICHPLHLALTVVVPDVGNEIIFLRDERTWKISLELIIAFFAGGFVAPAHVVAVNINNKIAVGCSTSVNPAVPPSPTNCSYIVLIQFGIGLRILKEVGVTAEHVYGVVFQNLLQLLGVTDVALFSSGVPACCVHV